MAGARRPRKLPARFEEMTRDDLVSALWTGEQSSAQDRADSQRVVDDLKAHQLDLETSHARLTDLYDFAPIGYVTLDPESRILSANLTAATLFAAERATLIGKPLLAMVPDSHRPTLLAHIGHCAGQGIRVESEIAFSLPGRPLLLAHVVSVPVRAPDGQVLGLKTTLTDITELKRAQEKLRFLAEASATLASSFDYRATLAQVVRQAVPVLGDICIVDLLEDAGGLRRLEVAFADPTTAGRLARFRTMAPRLDATSPVGKTISSKEPLLFPECSPASLASKAGGFEHETLIKAAGAVSMIVVPLVVRGLAVGAITVVAAESGRRYTSTSLATVRDLAAHAALAVDNARLYEQAQQAIRSREDLLSFVSHDMRNPLMGILLTTETMLRAARVEGERRKGWRQLERIGRGVQQLRHIIDDLLDVASLDAGRLTVHLGTHGVRRLFDDAQAVLAPIAVEKQVALQFVPPDEEIFVRCDPHRALQVLSNLIGNAIKFTQQGGSITVVAGRSDANALFAVGDTGPGIAPAVRPHIFERFWQAEETARKGRGLGLYIAKGLVEAQGGTIWVDSHAPTGSTFSFTLPLASPDEVNNLRSTDETTPVSGRPSP